MDNEDKEASEDYPLRKPKGESDNSGCSGSIATIGMIFLGFVVWKSCLFINQQQEKKREKEEFHQNLKRELYDKLNEDMDDFTRELEDLDKTHKFEFGELRKGRNISAVNPDFNKAWN